MFIVPLNRDLSKAFAHQTHCAEQVLKKLKTDLHVALLLFDIRQVVQYRLRIITFFS